MRGRSLIAIGLVAALVGCQESGFDESRETQRPLKVQHAMDMLTGTKVPGQAQRPLVLTADALGDTLALGVKPVRAALPGGRLPEYVRQDARGVEVVAPLTKLDLAATEAVDPDLILGSKEDEGGLYEDLSRIAPTVMTEGDNWKLDLRLHGEALGRTNDAEELLIDWDNRVARVKDSIGNRKLSVAVGDEVSPFADQVLADVGVKPLAEAGGGAIVLHGPQLAGGGVLAARAVLEDLAAQL